MEILKTIAIDIKHKVFDNETEAIMYITKDIYSDTFIVSVPVYTFSFDIHQGDEDRDYKEIYKKFPIDNSDQKERLVNTIKEGVELLKG